MKMIVLNALIQEYFKITIVIVRLTILKLENLNAILFLVINLGK